MSEVGTRARIVDAADELFYRRGYEHTSFADIADVVKISRGNFYHHFKTKDDILDAVIAQRQANTEAMLAEWDATGETPAARIRCFIQILIQNQAKIVEFGCPVGTLTSELGKIDHPSRGGANELFGLFRSWLARQFCELERAGDADTLAMQLLARSQGVATLASALGDTDFINREVDEMCRWLDAVIAEEV